MAVAWWEKQKPRPGEVWRSRDPRNDGLTVTILAVDEQFVYIQRFRKSRLRLNDRFYREYEFAALAGKDTTR